MATGSQTLSYQRVLVDWDQSLKGWLLDVTLEKVVPALVQNKAIPKKLGKLIQKKADVELLLGFLKTDGSFDKFIAFLEVVESICEEEGHKDVMKKLSSSLSTMSVRPGSDSEKVIKKFIATAHVETTRPKTCTETDPNFTAQSSELAHPLQSCPGLSLFSPSPEDCPMPTEDFRDSPGELLGPC